MHIDDIQEKHQDLDKPLEDKKNIEESLAILYHENSKLTLHSIRVLEESAPADRNTLGLEPPKQLYKCYPGYDTVALHPNPDCNEPPNPVKWIHTEKKRSNGDEADCLTVADLHLLLSSPPGIFSKTPLGGIYTTPGRERLYLDSADELYPLEVYVVLFKAQLPLGLYHYRPDKDCLEKIKEGAFGVELAPMIQAEPNQIEKCAALILTTGLIEKVWMKYGDRGYRFLMQEAGARGLLIKLLAESLDLEAYRSRDYYDDRINNVILISKKS